MFKYENQRNNFKGLKLKLMQVITLYATDSRLPAINFTKYDFSLTLLSIT